MPNIVAGFVKNGVVVPNAPLPEGAFVEVHVGRGSIDVPPELRAELDAWERASAQALDLVEQMAREKENATARVSPSELRKMPREQRQVILAAAAEKAEEDYRSDRDRIGFDAFSDKERDEEGS